MKLIKNIILCLSIMICCTAMVGCGEVPEDLSGKLSTECYSYCDGTYTYVAHVVANNSEKTVSLDASITAKDSSGNDVGYGNHQVDAIAPGQSVSLTDIFSSADVKDYSNSFKAFSTTARSCYGTITTTETLSHRTALINVENNTDETVFFLEVEVLFLKDGKLIEINGAQLMDNDAELKPHDSINQQLECYNSPDIDEIKVFYTGTLR